MTHDLVNILVLVAAAGIVGQWMAWQFRIPTIVILSLIGLLLGPVFGVLHPSEMFGDMLRPFVQLAVAIILFEGGLNLRLHELKEAGAGVKRLISIGLVVSFVLGTLAAGFIGGLSWPVATVFGAITVVTGPTVIMPLLRQARLKTRTASLLKWEGIVNDPLGALLAVAAFEFFVFRGSGQSGWSLGLTLVFTMAGSGLLGALAGYAIAFAFPRGWVPEFLKGPIMLAMVFTVYALGNAIHEEAGLVSVTALGVMLGNSQLPSMEELKRFKEYITLVLVSGLFVVLTADLDPASIMSMDWRSVALLVTVIFVLRPVTVFAATVGADVDRNDRLLAGWIAPRGIVAAAVAGAFADRLLEAGYADATKLLPLVFALILLTVILHGFSLATLARYLGLSAGHSNGVLIVGASPWSVDLASVLHSLKMPVVIADSSWHRTRPARLAGVPIFYGQILSESAEESLSLITMETLLAATDNDAYNALVCTHLGHEFGRNSVYQIPMIAQDQHDKKGLAAGMRGRTAFSDEALHEELVTRYVFGWRFQKTRLTETYTLDRYKEDYPEAPLAALLVRESGRVVFEKPLENAKAGDIIVSFQAPEAARVKTGQTSEKAATTSPDIA